MDHVRTLVCVLASSALAVYAVAGASAKGDGPSALAAHGATAWVGMGDGRIWRVKGSSIRTLDSAGVFVHGLASAFGSLWLVNGSELVRADPVTGRPRWSAGGSYYQLAVAHRSVWALDTTRNTVSTFTPTRNRLIARFRVPGRAWQLFAGVAGPWVVGAPRGWVNGPWGPRTLYRVDSGAAKLKLVRRLGCDVVVLEARGLLWLADVCRRRLVALDPKSGSSRSHAIPLNGVPTGMASAHGAIWVATQSRCGLQRIDPAAKRVTETICVSGTLLAAGARLWLASYAGLTGQVRRIDPRGRSPVMTIRLPRGGRY